MCSSKGLIRTIGPIKNFENGPKKLKQKAAVGTIFLVHFLDLPSIPPPLDDIEIKFIPDEIKNSITN
jgi:hypothetical protein